MVLRFRQGFGHLIRSKIDREVILVLGRRVMTKSDLAAFLNVLPEPTIMRAPLAQLGRRQRSGWRSKSTIGGVRQPKVAEHDG